MRKAWNKGIKGVFRHSLETKRKISLSTRGLSPVWLKNKKQSVESRMKKSDALKGSKSHLWIDGRSYDISHVNAMKLMNKLKKQETRAGRKRPSRCELCSDTVKICFDHDHSTGQFRGWICHRCNLAIAFAKDSPELLIKMSKYLLK